VQEQKSTQQPASAPIRTAALAMLASILILGASALSQSLPPSQYISFDAPNAGTGQYQGTGPSSINRQGWISGTVVYSTGFAHGFLRKPNGAFIAVNPPNSSQSFVAQINDSNVTVGSFYGTNATYGFLRDAAGNYTQLAVAGSNTTVASGISSTGVVVGFDYDSTGSHGFLWDAKRGYTVFDVPGSKPGTTIALAINAVEAVTGFYYDNSDYSHGFVRSRNGHFTTFEAVYGGNQTNSVAINANSQTTGWGNDGLGGTYGFLRNVGGASSIFGVAGSPGSAATALNDSGVIVGYDFSDAGGNGSFERDQSGNITPLALPFSNTGNTPTGINQIGQIVGDYIDAAGASHGWVGVP
jgi:hypothetical protein